MENESGLILAIAGLLVGCILGFIVQRSRFCMAAIVSNYVLLRDVRQFYTYLIAVLLAIAGVLLLEITGTVSIADSVYRSADIHWFSAILGGMVFGLGAVRAGGCIGRILTLTGEGNLGGLLALLAISLSATIVYTGVFEPIRVWIYGLAVIETDETSILYLSQLPLWLFISCLLLVFMMVIVLAYKSHLEKSYIVVGLMIGALVIFGWWVTGSLGVDEFSSVQRPGSLTFSGPLANMALYLTIGSEPQNLFGFMLVIGMLSGSFISAKSSGRFRLIQPAPDSFVRIFNGGLLMGIGAILAGGCNIGQGLTGLSTLSIESILVVGAIFAGMYMGIKWLQYSENHQSIWIDIRKYLYQSFHPVH